jgi:hypothetical protein
VQSLESNFPIVRVGRWKHLDLSCVTCGTHKLVRIDVVRSLDKESRLWRCNQCTASEYATKASTKHGKYYSGAYRSWIKMKDRCLNPNHPHSRYYLERGIRVCEKWMSFTGFYEDMGDRPVGYSLDRIDNDLGYLKENCRWIPLRDQPKNRRICSKPYIPPNVGVKKPDEV